MGSYLPHAGYPWADFENTFTEIIALAKEAQDRRLHLSIAGDFNLNLNRGVRGQKMMEFCNQFILSLPEMRTMSIR